MFYKQDWPDHILAKMLAKSISQQQKNRRTKLINFCFYPPLVSVLRHQRQANNVNIKTG